MSTTILRSWTRKNKEGKEYTVSLRLDVEKKEIVWINCTCPNFIGIVGKRMIKSKVKVFGQMADRSYKYAEPCKHLKDIIDYLKREEGYILSPMKEMIGTDKCTLKLRKALIDRSEGQCECGCGRIGARAHRIIRGHNSGKYSLDNCLWLCVDCHKAVHQNDFQGVRTK